MGDYLYGVDGHGVLRCLELRTGKRVWETEALIGKRGGSSTVMNRLIPEFLAQIDGLSSAAGGLLLLGATNRPWDLDSAVLSRFEKKILIPLPDPETRKKILEIHLEKKGFKTKVSYDELSRMTEGYSGREIERFCKEVTTTMVAEQNQELSKLVDKGLKAAREYQIQIRPLVKEDFLTAASHIHPGTTAEEMEKYRQWKETAEEE